MELIVQVSGNTPADDLARLRNLLLDEPSLQGRVRLRRAPAATDTMAGGFVDDLLVSLGGGAAALMAARTTGSVLIAWLKARRSEVQVKVTGPHGTSVSVDASNVKGLSTTGLSALVDRVADAAALGPAPGETGSEGGNPPNEREGLPPERTQIDLP